MYDEVKRVDLNWADKMNANEDYMYAFERLSWIDSYLQECDEILGEVGLGIDFTSRSEEIEVLSEERDVLWNYIAQLQSYNEANIDNPLYKSFVNGATQTMSTIRLENYTVDNNLGLTVEYFVNGSGTGPVTIEKGKLTFEDFIGTLDGKADGNFLYTQFANGSIEDFAIIFEQQYQSMLESGMLGDDKEMTQEEFLTQFYHQGEFNHKVDKPFASFVSSVLDITIIKPFIESCTGEEWFTGNQLTDMERGLKAVFAMVDLFTLGMGSVGTEITELGAKDALVFLGKTVTIDLASNAAVYGIGELGQALDWPAPITIMLSLATGITVSCIGNKLLFKNAEGVVIRETELSDAQVNKIGEMLENSTDSVEDIIKGIENGDIPLSNNIQKGNYGEMKMDAYFESQGYERISLGRVTDLNTPTHQGIDGVYYNPDGHPPYIIGEAKYGSSRLSTLADGTPQMSDKWIIDRLENAVGEEVANNIKMEMILNPDNIGCSLVHVSVDGSIDITELINGVKQ